jgi:hypothetical protein
LIRFLTGAILALGLVACGSGALTLAPADDQANNHMVSTLDYRNQFVTWMNSVTEQRRPEVKEWNSSLALLERAILEAKLVSPDFMRHANADLPDMWQGFLVPSMEKTFQYYHQAVSDPASVQLPSTEQGMKQLNLLLDARRLNWVWEEWYGQNRDAIRAGIRRMAR